MDGGENSMDGEDGGFGVFISVSNEPSDCLQAFGECSERIRLCETGMERAG